MSRPAPLAPVSHFGELGQPEAARPSACCRRCAEARRASDALDDEDDIDAIDAVDAELFPIFEEEGQELLPQLAQRMRDWAEPAERCRRAARPACARCTRFKGGARLAGAMRLGEMAHRLETAIEHLLAQGHATPPDDRGPAARVDALRAAFEALRSRDAEAYAAASGAVEQALPTVSVVDSEPMPLMELPECHAARAPAPAPHAEIVPTAALTQARRAPARAPEPLPAPALPPVTRTDSIDWQRFSAGSRTPLPAAERPAISHAAGARARPAARPPGQPGRRGHHHALAHRGRRRPAQVRRWPT